MPKVKIPFTEETLPATLKAYAGQDHSVEVWVGDKVAEETNPGLASNRDALKGEKDAIQTKYNALLQSSADASQELLELRNRVASGSTVSPEDVALLSAVKAAAPTAKADDIKSILTAHPTVVAELTNLKTTQEHEKLFALSGFKNKQVFTDLLGNKAKNPNLEKVISKKETVDGKEVEKLVAQVKEGNAVKEVAFDEYVKSNAEWSPYMPALTDGSESKSWLPQPPSNPTSSNGSGDPLAAYIDKMNKKAAEKSNPLLPGQAKPAQSEPLQN